MRDNKEQSGAARYRLTDAQVAEVELAKREVREGKIATDEAIAALWRLFGLRVD